MADMEVGAALELQGLPPDVPDELLTLYFENHRRSGGGPVLSWQRLGRGGIITFQHPADAKRVLAQAEHRLQGTRLILRPAPPRAQARVLFQGLPPGVSSLRLEEYVQALLSAIGHPVLTCQVLASPRQDRVLVQLPMPLSASELSALQDQTQNVALNGTSVSLAWVPQARAVRLVGGTLPVDHLLLELYLENERRSGGGPLQDLRSLPGPLGTVVTFQEWQVAERVLQRNHCLQGRELSLVPHYDVLDPEGLAEGASGEDHPTTQGPGNAEHMLLKAEGGAEALAVTMGSGKAPRQLGASPNTGPVVTPGQTMPVDPEPVGQEEPMNLGTVGSSEQAGFNSQGLMRSAVPVGIEMGSRGQEEVEGLARMAMESLETEPASPGHEGLQERDSLVELVMAMEPGAMRFLQLYHEDLLASLEDIALFPLEGMDVTGFRLCGSRIPCQAAQELLQSLLDSISRHTLSLKHPGSARFLLGIEGQHLLQELEARFQCVFGTEQLVSATLGTDPEKTDPTEALQVLPNHSMASDQDKMSLEEVRELLASLESLDGDVRLPLELEVEEPEEQPEKAAAGQEEEDSTCEPEEEPTEPSSQASARLEEEATLQLAIHRSLGPLDQAVEQEEAAALRQALALSLLEQPLMEAELLRGGSTSGPQLVVHAPFEQDIDQLDQALTAALKVHLQEETVRSQGQELPTELCARLERCHDVSVVLRDNCVILCGFGEQPARAARHLTALLDGPWDQNLSFSVAASDTGSETGLNEPLGKLEGLEEDTTEFQEVVQAFYSSLDAARSKIHIIRVERVSHPLLQQQYQLQRERLMQRCLRRPVEQVLYHGTSESAVPDICAHGFNRSFCGRNGTLYGQGVYFAKHASLSVQDRYSPPNAEGHKAVFVAQVLTGDYGQGRRGLRAPPLRASGQVLRYDSAVDCLHRPSIFVIFYDTQALPTYLITCKNMSRVSPGDPLAVLDSSLET